MYAFYDLLLFGPESTTDALRESLDFVRAHADLPMSFCRTEVYVGTPLMTRLARAGRLVGDVFGWDYEISEPAAERALRLFAYSFFERNFGSDGLMNATLRLGHHLHLLRRFYPHAHAEALHERTIEVIRKVNLDCVARMSRIIDFAENAQANDEDAFAEYADHTATEVEASNDALEAEVAKMTSTLARASRGALRLG